jgi:putative tricarboxylic transport membrane protein
MYGIALNCRDLDLWNRTRNKTVLIKKNKGPSRCAVDAAVAAIAFLIGVAVMIDTYHLGAGWAQGSPQSGYFPFRIGAIICIVSAVILLQSLFSKSRDTEPFVQWEQFKPVLLVLLPTLAYVLAIQLIGIYVASALFIAAFMRLMGRQSWLKIMLISIGVSAVLFWLFELQFLVPLPKGPLEALFGY